MSAASAVPVDFAQERAELEEVLRSPHFARAPKMAELLTYICEKRFAGETSQVKEYAIGVDVFRRGDDFDQDSDSIVRVEANRLRKKLAEYYAGPGAEHPLQITIPLGQYVPEFVPVSGPAMNAAEHPPVPIPVLQPLMAPSVHTRKWLYIGFGAVTLSAVIALAALWWRAEKKPSGPPSVAISAATPPQPIDLGVGPPTGDEVRILCGATRSLVDHAGRMWNADADFIGGAAEKSDAQHIWRTQESAFYRTSRQGNFRYDIPLKPGIYELRLHFAETEYGPETTGTGGEGSRVMNVLANGRTLLTNFDVVSDAGASRTADVKVFPDIAPANDGKLHLEFVGERGKDAMVSAIEIVPGVKGRMRPVRVLTRQTPYYSNESQWWSPDAYFQGGQQAIYAGEVRGTDDPELYDSERWGNFTYAIPVSPGRYTVTLSFVTRRGEWPVGNGEGSAKHVFNVFCNGRTLLSNFDLAVEARAADVVTRRFPALEPNAQGKLLLSFVPVQGYATVTGIEVTPQ